MNIESDGYILVIYEQKKKKWHKGNVILPLF